MKFLPEESGAFLNADKTIRGVVTYSRDLYDQYTLSIEGRSYRFSEGMYKDIEKTEGSSEYIKSNNTIYRVYFIKYLSMRRRELSSFSDPEFDSFDSQESFLRMMKEFLLALTEYNSLGGYPNKRGVRFSVSVSFSEELNNKLGAGEFVNG